MFGRAAAYFGSPIHESGQENRLCFLVTEEVLSWEESLPFCMAW